MKATTICVYACWRKSTQHAHAIIYQSSLMIIVYKFGAIGINVSHRFHCVPFNHSMISIENRLFPCVRAINAKRKKKNHHQER